MDRKEAELRKGRNDMEGARDVRVGKETESSRTWLPSQDSGSTTGGHKYDASIQCKPRRSSCRGRDILVACTVP